MSENTLANKKCEPCEGIGEAFSFTQAQEHMSDINSNWQLLHNGALIARDFKFSNFAQALGFTNKVGEIAESENHHPDIVLKWGLARVEIYTHAVDGLTENDFILAAKIDEL